MWEILLGMIRLLLVENEPDIVLGLYRTLNRVYRIECASTGRSALAKLAHNPYDVVILAQNLPDTTGLKVCEHIRSHGGNVPILAIGEQMDTSTKVLFLDSGADDFVGKPFDHTELAARLRAILRKKPSHLQTHHNRLVVGDLVLDTARHLATRAGVPIVLRRKEFRLLECLMRNAGKVVSGTILAAQAWENEQEELTNTLHVHIKHLRDKIDRPFQTALIRTVHGFGYKLELSALPQDDPTPAGHKQYL